MFTTARILHAGLNTDVMKLDRLYNNRYKKSYLLRPNNTWLFRDLRFFNLFYDDSSRSQLVARGQPASPKVR